MKELINGAPGFVVVPVRRPVAVVGFTVVVDGRIAEFDVLADAVRLGQLDISAVD